VSCLHHLLRCTMKASRGTMVKAKTPEGYRLSAVKSEPPVVRARKRCMQAAGTAAHRSGQQTSSRSSAPPVTIDLSEKTESEDDVEPRAARSLKKARRPSEGLSSACFHRARQRRPCTYVAHHLASVCHTGTSIPGAATTPVAESSCGSPGRTATAVAHTNNTPAADRKFAMHIDHDSKSIWFERVFS
jgi:hypothetical protein